MPEKLRTGDLGKVMLATVREAPGLREAERILGTGNLFIGDQNENCSGGPFFTGLTAWLYQRGIQRVLCEGGPSLLSSLLAAGIVDELNISIVPTLLGGFGPTLLPRGTNSLNGLSLNRMLVAADGTLFGSWTVASRCGGVPTGEER